MVLLLNGIGCVDDPGGQPFNGVGAVRRSESGKANQVSPITPGVALTGSIEHLPQRGNDNVSGPFNLPGLRTSLDAPAGQLSSMTGGTHG